MDLQLVLVNFQPSSQADSELHFAALRGDLRNLEQLLSRPRDPNCVIESDGEIQTPLRLACREGHAEVVSLLLEAMANVSMEFGPFGMEETALGTSCERHDARITRMLLGARANPNAVHYSIRHGSFEHPLVMASCTIVEAG